MLPAIKYVKCLLGRSLITTSASTCSILSITHNFLAVDAASDNFLTPHNSVNFLSLAISAHVATLSLSDPESNTIFCDPIGNNVTSSECAYE